MKILITKLIGAALILGSTHSYAAPNFYSITNIPTGSSLTLRAWPSQISQPLTSIPANTNAIRSTGKTITLDTTNWLQITYDDKVGWVESNYLAQTEQLPAPTSIPTNNIEVANTAEIFSYSSDPTPEIQTTTNQTNNQYPWSAEADTIYNDPTPNNTASATHSSQENTSSDEPVLAEATTHPQPVVINTTTTPIDYKEENLSVNRYEAIETAATVDFIGNQ